MNKEDKDLLLKYLCMALPYKLKVETPYNCATLIGIINRKGFKKDIEYIDVLTDKQTYPIRYIKPFLRPMSSMTEKESNELESITFPLMKKDWDGNENPACIRWIDIPKYMDFILSHHFDYQGLIEKGLAIEVTEDNNPYKD